ncbi:MULTISPECIES: CRISPR-associated endonuclease Cas2 [unclassified Barnesiella]|uniref:CRISPR-associated endonuclease Cas2 n=2 Tax=Barnesiella TaxID=397864 RepID=UPI000B38259F|nr:CRISPR-associated endonuclease Cas2 [Barnesiella sp. An22]MCR8910543.1 CRISPR-associated endonuclease Cas2 [Barnesiella sp. ET7]OUO98697.1 CRISPR-associated endonuclease Cas2 [Barnesiella sp. An22]
MIIISYDLADDLLRSRFQRMLTKNGAIRLQYSVYEVVNTRRVLDNIKIKINAYAKHFSPADSVILFEVDNKNLIKYGHAIHRDTDIVFF